MFKRFRPTASFATIVALTALAAPPPFVSGSVQPEPAELERAFVYADGLSAAFEHTASAVAPSVVNVRSVVRVSQPTQPPSVSGPFGASPFREFFGDRFFQRYQGPRTAPNPRGEFFRQGQGTGFVVSSDGYILTNNHVIDNAAEVTVQTNDGNEHSAVVVGADPSTDLALLKIDAGRLTPARFGDSDDLRVGAWVVAVGNPFGLESTITAGIVSAKGRSRVGIADYEDFIQTDAAINPGNSGGPLVNLRGEVVGVNTAIATRSGGNMGIGFAIPSNLAVSVFESLRDDGVVTRGWLGVAIQDLTPALAGSFGFHGSGGVLISHVEEGGPAAESGLAVGDIVTAFNGRPLDGVDQFRMLVASAQPGDRVELRLYRDESARAIEVEIGERDRAAAPVSAAPATDRLGLQLRDLEPSAARQLGLPDERGVLVAGVQPLSAAARAGMREGDVITHVHGRRVESLYEFGRALLEHDLANGVRLSVRTGSAPRFVFLQQ